MKKFFLGVLCGMILSASSVVYASDTIQTYLFPVKYIFNGEERELSNEYITLNHNGHAYVPIRFIVENMGGTVGYYNEPGVMLINNPLVVQYNRADLGSPSIEGYITKVESERILVVSPNPRDFYATNGVKERYDAVWVSNVPKDVNVGQQVQVWFEFANLSYPAQAMSDKISFKPTEKPQNSTLSEEQVIQKVITTQEYANLKVVVIKDVTYDENTDIWVVQIKEGMSFDTNHDEEYIIQIPDKR